MKSNLIAGEYSKSQITDIPADLETDFVKHLDKTLKRFPDEAIYIYSFEENKMTYARGWEKVLGYKDEEITMLKIVSSTSVDYAPFANELNDKALQFIVKQTQDFDEYSFTIELKKIHKNGSEVPLISRVSVFESKSGHMTSIIGRSEINNSINLGKVMRYAAFGPKKSKFEDELNKQLFKYFAISHKEKEALSLVAKGYAYKEIADMLGISQSAVEKRVQPLCKRFKLKSTAHLVGFAYENHILP
ncbi:MAG: LuxR C-terminal-related transcriptional regulator [Bacteroidota bacterium]